MAALRVLVADDEQLMRAALRLFLDRATGIDVVAEAADGREAVELSRDHAPDVVLMDLRMPIMSGTEATAAIAAQQPEIRVLALTTLATDQRVIEALRAGASGYLVKDTAPEHLITAIRTVAAGDFVLSPQLARSLVADARSSPVPNAQAATAALTPREHSILQHLGGGKSNSEIAGALNLAESTVKANMSRIMIKWDLRDRTQVLIRAVERGFVTLPRDHEIENDEISRFP